MSGEFATHSLRLAHLAKRIVKDVPALLSCGLAERGVLLTENARSIERLRDRHRGEVAFMVGSGPSVRLEDLEKLRGRLTFCCNRFFLSYPNHGFRPTYTLSSDPQVVEDFGREIADRAETPVFYNHRGTRFEHPNVVYIHQRWSPNMRWFSRNPHAGIWPGGGTLIFGIQLAYFMGVRKFYLYGIDHSFKFDVVRDAGDATRSAKGEGNHFIPNYRSGKAWWPPDPDQISSSFRLSDQFLRSEGGWVLNATRGGKLDAVERREFDVAVAESPTAGNVPS